jgi:hypothetical protein
VQQLFGWPAYLIRNASGQKYGKHTDRESARLGPPANRLQTLIPPTLPSRLQPRVAHFRQAPL